MTKKKVEMPPEAAKKVPKEYNLAKTPFSWDKLEGLLAYKSSITTCAEMLDCPESTIKDHIRKRYGLTFTEYSAKKLSRTRIKLVQKAIEKASSGNVVMLIFCLKNLCGWADKAETKHEVTTSNYNLGFSEEQLQKAGKTLDAPGK